jgi:hypothetical protein
MTELSTLIGEHWFLAWCAMGLTFGALCMSLRAVMVLFRGWPPSHRKLRKQKRGRA